MQSNQCNIVNFYSGFALAGLAMLIFFAHNIEAEELDYSYGAHFQIIRPLALPRNETYLETGQSSLRSNLSWMNVWSLQDERFLLDGEELLLSGTYRYAFSNRLQIGLHFIFINQSGGVFDDSIEGFHDISNVGQSQRTQYAQNKFNVSYEPYGAYYPLFDKQFGETLWRRLLPRPYPRQAWDSSLPFDIDDRLVAFSQGRISDVVDVPIKRQQQSGPGDPRLFIQYVVWRGNDIFESLHIGMETKIPIHGGELIGAPGVDFSFSMLGRQNWSAKIKTYTGASVTYFGNIRYRFFKLPRYQWSLRSGIDFLLDSDLALFTEYIYFSPPTSNFGELSKPGHQIAVGIRAQINKRTHMQFALIENFINFGVTPDIGLHISCDYRL